MDSHTAQLSAIRGFLRKLRIRNIYSMWNSVWRWTTTCTRHPPITLATCLDKVLYLSSYIRSRSMGYLRRLGPSLRYLNAVHYEVR